MVKEFQTIAEEIDKVSDMFYQNCLEEGIAQLPQLVKKLAEAASAIPTDRHLEFMRALKKLMESMEQQDYILVADILVFEVRDLL